MEVFGNEEHMKEKIREILPESTLKFIDKHYGKFKQDMYFALDKVPYIRKLHIEDAYYQHIGKHMKIDAAQSFNEKLQWLKYYYRDYRMPICADKYYAKEYISSKGLGQYVPKLYGVYEKAEEIDYDKLPDKFVLKTSHGSGFVIVCTDKAQLNISDVQTKLNEWLNVTYSQWTWEWHYNIFKPCIFAEEYIESDRTDGDLLDYKIICMNGKCCLSFVIMNRKLHKNMTVDFYDNGFNKLPFERLYKKSDIVLDKPDEWEKMIEIAEKLSKDFPLCRVDFFIGKKQLYIGELTFFPGSGWEVFEPDKYDYIYGDMLKLPSKDECRRKKAEYKKFLKKFKSGKYTDKELVKEYI